MPTERSQGSGPRSGSASTERLLLGAPRCRTKKFSSSCAPRSTGCSWSKRMPELPTGTVTFLFTDVEGSTRLWEEQPEAMKAALARHDEILRDAVQSHAGHIVKTTGDG